MHGISDVQIFIVPCMIQQLPVITAGITGHDRNGAYSRMKANGNGNMVPVEAQYLYRKAVEFSNKGKYDTALNYLRQVVMIAPHFSKAFNEMGNCLCHMGREREALAKYEKALTIDPGFEEALLSRNSVLDQLGRNETIR